MTNIQAIDLLKDLEQSLDDYCELNDEGKTAFRMAITALELFGISEQLPSAQPKERTEERTETHSCDYQRTETHDWIPVTERLPERNGYYLVTGRQGAVNKRLYQDGYWYGNWAIIAWMPLPPSYKGDEDERN